MDQDTNQETERSASRRKVLASSATGAAMFGASGLVGTAAAEERVKRGSQPTAAELERSLQESDHIGIRRRYKDRVDKDAISSVDELDTSVTPGRGHPDIYFGEFENAQSPSGDYYSLADSPAEADSSAVPVSVDENDVSADFVSFEETLGCAGIDFAGISEELCATLGAGLDIAATGDGKIGGNLFVDFTLKHPNSGAQITISPAGFGVYVDVDNPLGICLDLKLRAPGPIPGKLETELCFDYTFTVDGSDLNVGFEFSKLEVCVEDDAFCANVLTISPGFEFTVADVSDFPFLSRDQVSPELPNGSDI